MCLEIETGLFIGWKTALTSVGSEGCGVRVRVRVTGDGLDKVRFEADWRRDELARQVA